MNPIFKSLVAALALFAGMCVLLEIGIRVGRRRLARDQEGARAGAAAIEGALFALLGLLIAFTFSGAASRFDTRRTLIVQEANVISTTWLRIDLLPAEHQPRMRELLRQYLEARLATYASFVNPESIRRGLDEARRLQTEIWALAVNHSHSPPGSLVGPLLLPALNEMFALLTTRTAVTQNHQPPIVFALLFLLSLTCSVFAGLAMSGGRRRSWLHMIGFAAVISLSVYVILDLEFPRLGLIRIDAADHVLIELRDSMN